MPVSIDANVLTPSLCVDLDGTLTKSDTLIDSVLTLARHRPSLLLRIPGWIMEGKPAFKRQLSTHTTLDVVHLPYNRRLLSFLREQHASGRTLYLATAADMVLAQSVANHLGIFKGVIATDLTTNLAGANKLAAFRDRFGDDFSYIGNATADLPILTVCREPMVANPSTGLSAALRDAGVVPAHAFTDHISPPAQAWFRAIRIHQWSKNVLVFLPFLLAHVRSGALLAGAAVAFLSFGLCASATYIFNDLLDLEADRRHHRKCRRPFAAADLNPIYGVAVTILFLAGSLVLALLIPHVVATLDPSRALLAPRQFLSWLALYAVMTVSYSLRFKRSVLVDVIVLSLLYTMRILAGSAATGIAVSTWLGGFSVFFFLSLAFVKRFSELESLRDRLAASGHPPPVTPTRASGRGYLVSDLEQLRSSGTASGIASVVVLTLYISSLDSANLYVHAGRLWLLVPVLLLWILRLWLLASRGELHEDPVVYAITDRNSLLLGLLVLFIVLSASFSLPFDPT